MAFVFRQQHDSCIKSHTPGPSYYQPEAALKSQKKLVAPFNQSSSRKIWEQNNVPGPGAYNASLNTQNERLLVQQSGKLFLLSSKTESFNFKSACERFKSVENKLPGPGQYQNKKIYPSSQSDKNKRGLSANNKNNLQKYLLMTHNHKAEEKPVKLQIILDKQNNLNSQIKFQKAEAEKKEVPFYSSVERSIKPRPQTSLGPGSYNVSSTQKQREQLGKAKPSYSLAKFKKVIATQNQDKQWMKNEAKLSLFKADKKNLEEITSSNFLNKKKEEFFGSTVGRFVKTQIGNMPGPGSYELANADVRYVQKEKSKLAFGRVSLPEKTQFQTIVSPFVGNPSSVQKKIEPKFVQMPKSWNFGSKEPRFKQKFNQNNETQLQYANLNIGIGVKKRSRSPNEENIKLKLKLKKQYTKSSKRQKTDYKDDRPLCYAPQVNTIARKLGQKCQMNAPFTSQATRFGEIDNQMNIIDELLWQNQKDGAKENRRLEKKAQPKGLMESNNPRFKYKEKGNDLSPCTYDPLKPAKKEFNRLFL